MNITKHFKKRYVQRITGLSEDNKISQYIGQNEAQLNENINKMFEHSKFLFTGYVGNNKASANFNIVDNIILVYDQNNLITLYRIDFNFPDEINRSVMKGLLHKIETLQEELSNVTQTIESHIQNKTITIENLNVEILALQRQLEIKTNYKKVLEDEIKFKRCDAEYLNKEIEKYVHMLCNSMEYKKAMLEIVND